jgi:ABC-type sugar transport system ATPase subunit
MVINRKHPSIRGNMAVLRLEEIDKSFPGVQALKKVSLDIEGGEIHALMGLNGAGKSTLINILSGVYKPDGGSIIVDGEPVQFCSPTDSGKAGIATIHQEFNLIDWLTVWENVVLGHESGSKFPFKLNNNADRNNALDVFREMGVTIDIDRHVRELPVGQKQFVEIAKALSLKSRILLLDEPTTPLNQKETQELFELITRLKESGCAIIFISHHIEEIMEISDRVTILRDGQKVASWMVRDIKETDIVKAMAGKEMADTLSAGKNHIDYDAVPVLRLKNVFINNKLKDISFEVKKSEILGIAGLQGSGRTELLETIAGILDIKSGSMEFKGEVINPGGPRESMKRGITLITEDRKASGIIPEMSLEDNISLSGIVRGFGIGALGLLKSKTVRNRVQEAVNLFNINPPHFSKSIRTFSGGNQQKAVIGRAFCVGADLFLLDEPTRGVDVYAREEIYKTIMELARNGRSFLIVSSDFNELLNYCHRILVLYQGSIRGELKAEQLHKENLLNKVMGN